MYIHVIDQIPEQNSDFSQRILFDFFNNSIYISVYGRTIKCAGIIKNQCDH